MPKIFRPIGLTRDQLANFLLNAEQIKQFENLFALAEAVVDDPDNILVISIAVGTAQTTANAALAEIDALAQTTAVDDAVLNAKVQQALDSIARSAQVLELLALAPRSELGTMAPQNADNVNITGGKISGLIPALPVNSGGTGQSTFTDGQLLIGNTTGNTLTKAVLTAGANITITNGTGSISIEVSGLGTMAFQNVGASGSFTSGDLIPKTVTVSNGIITSIV